jgi:hypothetical protein
MDAEAADAGEAGEEACVDGGGGFAVELLVDDGLGEGFKGGLLRGQAHCEGAGAGDELGKPGVGGGEMRDGLGGVVGELAAAVGRVRHVGIVPDWAAVLFVRRFLRLPGVCPG